MSAQTSGWTLRHWLISRERQKRPGICMSWGLKQCWSLGMSPTHCTPGRAPFTSAGFGRAGMQTSALQTPPGIADSLPVPLDWGFGFSCWFYLHIELNPQSTVTGLSLWSKPCFTTLHHSHSVKVAIHLRLSQASHWPKAIPSKFCEHLQHPYYSAFLSC